MERLKLIDDIRTRALSLMKEDSSLSYDIASKEARIQITGEDILITRYHQGIDMETSYLKIAEKELGSKIRVDLYQEEQLKQMTVANRLGVDLESFINIFFTPEQIFFITLVSLMGEDITKYVTDIHFDPEEEMEELKRKSSENGYQKVYTGNFSEAA